GMTLDYYDLSIIETVPRVYEEIANSFHRVYGVDLQELPLVLRFGSWVGGDRDGNPHVTASCTRESLRRAREVILSAYLARLRTALRRLSASAHQVTVSRSMAGKLEEYDRTLPELKGQIAG